MDTISISYDYKKKKELKRYATSCIPFFYLSRIFVVLFYIFLLILVYSDSYTPFGMLPYHESSYFVCLCIMTILLFLEFSFPTFIVNRLYKKSKFSNSYVTFIFSPTEFTIYYNDIDKKYVIPYTELNKIKISWKTFSFMYPIPQSKDKYKLVLPTKPFTTKELKQIKQWLRGVH